MNFGPRIGGLQNSQSASKLFKIHKVGYMDANPQMKLYQKDSHLQGS